MKSLGKVTVDDGAVDGQRREFMRNALAMGGAAALATASTGAALLVNPEGPVRAEDMQPRGYHVTDHIRDYYKTARL